MLNKLFRLKYHNNKFIQALHFFQNHYFFSKYTIKTFRHLCKLCVKYAMVMFLNKFTISLIFKSESNPSIFKIIKFTTGNQSPLKLLCSHCSLNNTTRYGKW